MRREIWWELVAGVSELYIILCWLPLPGFVYGTGSYACPVTPIFTHLYDKWILNFNARKFEHLCLKNLRILDFYRHRISHVSEI